MANEYILSAQTMRKPIDPALIPPIAVCRPPNALIVASRSPLGWIIRRWTRSRWNHAGAFSQPEHEMPRVVEALRRGIVENPLMWSLENAQASCVVEPPSDVWFDADLERMLGLMRSHIGVRYDWRALVRFTSIQADRRLFCSEAVAFWWDELLRRDVRWPLPGRRLAPVTPEDLFRWGRLVWISETDEARAALMAASPGGREKE